ncbi:MAG: type IV toxin-antitoxin system AbiEi family antitoxin [Candidatus Hinthialibacter antarcticus]|nr:type IV toxin-antitoxin system AbiEi family antitoxin [Candidatus Hinthialibacter antarcticus]
MNTNTGRKLKKLLDSQPAGTVLLSSWLTRQGYSLDLQKVYKKNGWFESIGHGALIRAGNQVGFEGGIYALQKQIGSRIHPGGRTALAIHGKGQYLELDQKNIVLFGKNGEKLPQWFKNHNWGVNLSYHRSDFLPPEIGLVDLNFNNFQIKISNPIRALLECLHLAPKKQELTECYEIMESLNNLRPDQVQALLETCKSIKVKRLFMFMAEKSGHAWFSRLDAEKIDMGVGVRSIVENGVYEPKYKITLPPEMIRNDEATL